MAKILSGQPPREKIIRELSARIKKMGRAPTLAIIQVGSRVDSNAYVRQKKVFAKEIGARVEHHSFAEDAARNEILQSISELNTDSGIDGIIVQLPLPKHLIAYEIIEAIAPHKDVDGLTSVNVKHLYENDGEGFVPATARGVLTILKHYKIPISGKNVVVVGRSTLVGKPTALLLLNQNATVTVCHSGTENLPSHTKVADILVVAAGRPRLIGKRYVSRHQTIIDVGINMAKRKLEDEITGSKLTGDVDFRAVSAIVKAISPVPGGVGPLTVASLFENLVKAATSSKSVVIKS